ncbi:hypothetical protein D3C78_1758610 [compost metagenome]
MRYTFAAVNTNGHIAINGNTAHNSMLVTVIINCIVLGGTIIPYDNITDRPPPAHRVLQTGDMILQQVKQILRICGRQSYDFLREVAQNQGTLPCLRMDVN